MQSNLQTLRKEDMESVNLVENHTYEKTVSSQTNFDQTLPDEIRGQAKLSVKDEYTFDFLELGEKHSEHNHSDKRFW